MTRGAAALALVLALAATPAGARAAEFDFGDWKLDLSANVREVVTVTRELAVDDLPRLLVDPNHIPLSSALLATTRVRIQLEGRYRDHWSGQIVYDNEVFLGTGRDSVAFRLAEDLGAPTWLDIDNTLVDSADVTWRNLLYRGWVRYQADAFEVTLGRQRIALGRAQLWNPSDLFNPIPPLAVEGDQRIGVDAALVRARLRGDLWLAAITAPGRDDQEFSSAVRLELSKRELDAALMFAVIDRDYVAGIDFATNLGDAALRGELTETWHQDARARPTLQAVLSLDYTFAVGTGLYGLVEHFYNQNVQSRNAFNSLFLDDAGLQRLADTFLSPTQITTVSRNQTGVQVGYDVTPLVRASLLLIYDWHGPSAAIAPSLSWSPRDDLELSAGVQLYGGADDEGEYGGRPPLWFLRADLYF